MAEGDLHFKAYIDTDTTSFQRNIKQAQSSVTSLSNTFGGLSKVITKALSVAGITASVGGIVKFGKESVKAAESANKSFNVLNNTIRATGATAWTTTDDIVQMSKELADASNYTVSEIQDMQSVLLGFRNITGDTFEEASEAIMDMATVMGMDLKSATQTVGKALDDPIKGLDSLRRQGFQFTDEQKAELTQLVKNGKQLEAQKIILEELATTYGGAAKAAQSSFARAKNATIELKETLGNQLMPVINEVLGNSTNTIKQLTSEIQKIDFTRIYAMLKNITDMIKPAFEDIVNYFREFGSEIKNLFGSDTIKPFTSLLDTVLGLFKTIFNEVKSNFERVKDMFGSIKEGLGGLADSGALQNITNVINNIIDIIWFLHEQIVKVQEEIRAVIADKIKIIWNFIKQLFDNSNKALEESEKGFASWAEYFYSQFDQVFRIAQDLINGVSALLHGNWAVAWEYAKLSTMRACKVVLDSISQIANAFPNLINTMLKGVNWLIKEINKFREWLGQEPLNVLGAFESVDLTESSGLGKAISDAEKKIEELTGKAADTSIKSLKGISKASQGMVQSIIDDITDVTDTYVSNSDKQYATAVSTNAAIENDTENSYQMYSEWDSKLLQQRQENLKEWQKEYHKINLQLIEEERKKALEADTTGADTEKINKYYDNLILSEKKRFYKAEIAIAVETTKKVAEAVGNVAKLIINTISNTISGLFNITKNIFTKLFKFNPDEALEGLLEFEDSVLTFFVETLPKLPGFFESALSSVSTLLSTLLDSIDLSAIEQIIKDIAASFEKYIPEILNYLSRLFDEFINPISNMILNAVDSLINNGVFGDVLEKIGDFIANFVGSNLEIFTRIVDSILPALTKTIFAALPQFLSSLIVGIVESLKTLINVIVELLPDLINTILSVLDTLIDKVLPNLIPNLITAIIKIIQSITKALPKLISQIIKLVGAIIKALPDILSRLLPEIIAAVVEILPQIITETIKAVASLIGNLTTGDLLGIIFAVGEAVLKIGASVITLIPNMISEIFKEIKTSIENMSWEDIKKAFKDGWEKITDNFKKTWDKAIKSISSSFENAFKVIKDTIQWIWDKIQAIIEGVGKVTSGVKDAVEKAGGGKVADFVEAAVDTVAGAAKKTGSAIKSGAEWVGGKIKGLFGFANGTNNAPMGLSLVGEAGPELVRFRGGEQVLNARNTQKALAGISKGSPIFNVTFNNTQDTTAFAMMSQLKQYQRNLAFNGVL